MEGEGKSYIVPVELERKQYLWINVLVHGDEAMDKKEAQEAARKLIEGETDLGYDLGIGLDWEEDRDSLCWNELGVPVEATDEDIEQENYEYETEFVRPPNPNQGKLW